MEKKLLRNAIIMALASLGLALWITLYLNNAKPGPVPGADVYTASAKGYASDIHVVVSVKDGKLLAVEADVSGETPELGGKAGPVLCQAITVAGGLSGVDGMTGATVTSDAILDAVADCLAQAGL